MAEPDMYIQAACTECGTLIFKPQETTSSASTTLSYRSETEIPKTPRRATSASNAVCSQCRGKTALSAKDLPK